MSKNWHAYARHVRDTIRKIERIRERGDLTSDEVLYDATLRNLQTLSEATQRIPDDVKQRFPEIPWKEIGGFRNILVHNYLGDIDSQTVRSVVETHLPPLDKCVARMLDEESSA